MRGLRPPGEGLRVTDVGAGPAVLLIHGHPFDRSLWMPQVAPLTAAGYRVIAPDLRGYGESPVTPGVVEMHELAADLTALLDSLEIATAATVGLSMGGLVAMELAHASPDRVSALGLVATTAEPVTRDEAAQRLVLARVAEAEGVAPLIDAMAGLYGPRCPPDVIARVEAMMRRASPAGAAAALRGRARRPDYRTWLPAIQVPTLVCAGTADRWSNDRVTTEIITALREPDVVVLQDVGHLPNLEASDAFNFALIDFVKRALRG